jgi:hypothetical protein
MITKNQWLSTNLNGRLENSQLDFKIFFKPYHFQNLSFDSACDFTAKEISQQYQRIFLGLSGGIDSEFVLKIFLRNNLKITPIVIEFEGNEEEREYAYAFCKENDIDPTVLKLNNKELMEIVYHDIFKKYNGHGIYALGSIAAYNYATANNGILILGEHAVGDGTDHIENFQYYFSEWDDYVENIPFYVYNMEIFYAMMKTIDNKYGNWMTYKSHVFQCQQRNKIKPKLNPTVASLINRIKAQHSFLAKDKFFLGSKDDVNNLLECWKIS